MPIATHDHPLELQQLLPALVEQGLITAQAAQKVAPASGSQHPLECIAAQGPCLETLTQWLARQVGQPYLRIDPLKIDVAAVVPLMSHAFAQRHGILAIAVDTHSVTIASAQPHVTTWEAGLSQVLRRTIKRVVANPSDIQRCINEFYRLAKSVSGADDKMTTPGNLDLLSLGPSDKEPDANDAHIVNIVDWLLQYAFGQRASDIHIEPCRDQGRVRFRIDGLLHDVYQFPPQVTMAVVSRLKSLGRMNVAEKRKPQDGRVKTRNPAGVEVELRLSTLPTAFGEKLVMRIFDPQVLLKDFDQLGLSNADQQRWHAMTRRSHGIILVTGPTGSGKTSTLYTTLRQLATREVNLCTVEDPIEMVEPAFNQMQVQHNIDLTFASGIRALLRQDPDIIMIGEIRDQETAEMAIQAALTGHLVFSTLHTNDAPSAISRLQELGVAHYLIKATLIGVMAQRLVRLLCSHCKRPLGQADVDGCEAVGCAKCRDSGYRGRAGLYEIMLMDPALQALVTPGADVHALRREALAQGMSSLRMAGVEKVKAGLTTMTEVLRVTPGDSETNPLFVGP
ncbi:MULTISPECIES: GspE/PulE family protein [Pseudomonas]|uniref:Type II secretion system protein E n=1 Tax=Pseudomonas cedrina TaxID=651740 RepID=A0A2S9DMU6_PSECE|nr:MULTISPECIES: GspE/PulE family protein [Pseudomonas]AVJ25148.1 type II secretion system protein E [Pseudomonas sp. MYb193]PRC01632.1 type II secretion system protein E [Pseudomonas cedrina]